MLLLRLVALSRPLPWPLLPWPLLPRVRTTSVARRTNPVHFRTARLWRPEVAAKPGAARTAAADSPAHLPPPLARPEVWCTGGGSGGGCLAYADVVVAVGG